MVVDAAARPGDAGIVIRDLWTLGKPRIALMVMLATMAGAFIAQGAWPALPVLVAVVLGAGLAAAGPAALAAAGIASVTRIGDCLAPSTIAAAVYAGHRLAREIDSPPPEGVPFLRELPELAALLPNQS